MEQKKNFADFVKDAKSVARFSPSRQFQVGPKQGLATKTVSKRWPSKSTTTTT